jgi:hypothetical protein
MSLLTNRNAVAFQGGAVEVNLRATWARLRGVLRPRTGSITQANHHGGHPQDSHNEGPDLALRGPGLSRQGGTLKLSEGGPADVVQQDDLVVDVALVREPRVGVCLGELVDGHLDRVSGSS